MENQNKNAVNSQNEARLDDEQRIRVLSPTMLVVKRFFRNRLAIAGLVIIIAMVLFSFLGGVLSPYYESQIFYKEEEIIKVYASASYNRNFYYTVVDGEEFPSSASQAMINAINSGESSFTAKGIDYAIAKEGEDFYRLSFIGKIASARFLAGEYRIEASDNNSISDGLAEAFVEAIKSNKNEFEYDGALYYVSIGAKASDLSTKKDCALASKLIFSYYDPSVSTTFDWQFACQSAIGQGKKSFTANGEKYSIEYGDDYDVIKTASGENFATAGDVVVTAAGSGIFLTVDFKDAVTSAIVENKSSFDFTDEDGNTRSFIVTRKDLEYTVKADESTVLIDTYASPTLEHPFGTDSAGMDLMTRMMYGGRVSLTIGVVVVLIETILGIILGGVAGYFGKWIDNLIMRLVDIFNCIPTLPLYIILGGIMDAMKVPSTTRIYYLMIILGVMGWPSIARVVRGQILSLREQEFMTAAEATGVTVSRRIFRHLVPNVIPQLIVYATMGLGSVIITEATLSFLGLGVKFPYASWGNIINAVNDSYVMMNFPFVWIPAGVCILLTVLGFNFIGDGLRDAFDPKMKR